MNNSVSSIASADSASLKRPKLISGSIKYVFASAYFMLLSYFVLVLVARDAQAAAFGRYVLVISILLWIERITGEAFTNSFINEMARGKVEAVSRLKSIQLFWMAGFFLILFGLAKPIALLFGSSDLAPILRVAALDIIPFSLYVRATAFLNAYDRYSEVLIGSMVYSTGKFVFMIAGLLIFGEIEWVVAGMVAASTLAAIVTWFLFTRQKNLPEANSFDYENSVSYTQSLVLTAAGGVLLTADIWLFQLIGSSEVAMGNYGAAHNLTKILYTGALGVMWPMIPTISRYGSVVQAREKEPQIRHLTMMLLFGLSLASLSFFLFAPFIINLLFGSGYEEASYYVRVLTPAQLILTLGLVATQILFHCGQAKRLVKVVVISSLAFFPLAWFAALQLKALGIALALSLIGIILIISALRTSPKHA